MDRSWMSKDRRSKDYADGVESFIAFALQYSTYKNSMKCPCLQCGNMIFHTPQKIREHLFFYGIDQSYHTWYWHGDAAPSGPPTSRAEWHHTVEFNDVDSTIEMVQVAYDDRKNDPKLFETLLEDAQKPLYPGCKNFTKLSALVKLYNLKARYGWSDKSFSELLSILGDMLPLNNELPLSMYEAKKTLNTLGMEYEKIHACPNDCILYRNELKDATSCPTCGTSRWKLDGRGSKKRKGVPAKVMWYFPPIPRFRRLFQSPKIAKDLIWHAQEREFDGKMRHPSDSPSWKLVDHRWPDFASEPRNLRLAISADGPRQPGNDIDVYLAPLLDDLKMLWDVGVECYDVHQQEVFTLRAVLLWTINDFPAYGNLSGHRRFLPCNHPFRKQKKAFNGKQEFSSPPQPLSGEEILRKIDVISNSWGKNKNSRGKLNVNTTNCWKKKSIFFDLEYWKYLHVRHSLDVMHIEKNVCESIIGTLLTFQVPEGYCSNMRNLVSMEDLKLYGLKSHDYHTLMQQLLPIKVVDVSALDKLQNDLVVTLCLLEKYFPPSFFDIMLHLTVHLVREVRLCGPVYLRWMYPFERFMKVLKGYVRNRNRPEGCIAECYIAEEAIEFCTEYLSNVDAIGIPVSANIDQKVGAPIPGGQVVTIDSNLWLHAHHYVLENTTIVQPYIEEHMEWLKLKNPRQSKRQKWLQDEHLRTFTYWLRKKIEAAIGNNEPISETLKWIAHGPSHYVSKYHGYVINGCRYHTKERDDLRTTQNSGVSIVASTMQIASAKDQNPVFGELCFYGIITEIWDLDYTMFRIPVFKCDWVDNKNGIKVDDLGFTLVDFSKIAHKSDPFILASQAKQVFYVQDQLDPRWSVVLSTPQKDFLNMEGGEDFVDNSIEHHPFIGALPQIEAFDVMDDSDATCMRGDCEGIWVENKSSM
ncbi:hypothetical protein CK203_006331 [Vitis vinifera]|uniref:Transposase-associated domain-containing protein n=1 Tax=Vitis vinifera TaxID=29760 RepID=A0A438KB27_VITVI|nr:hypothetical protein CK203_006331 [Vitis vinifera]